MNNTGKLIALEGGDRLGKSSQIAAIREQLTEQGIETETIAFPSRNTDIGKCIDSILKNPNGLQTISERTKLILLCCADRMDWVAKIHSWLNRGVYVLCDRYIYSGAVYGSLYEATKEKSKREEKILEKLDWCLSIDRTMPIPDLTFYFDGPINGRKYLPEFKIMEKIEVFETLDQQKTIQYIYRLLLKKNGENWLKVDADNPKHVVTNFILSKILE